MLAPSRPPSVRRSLLVVAALLSATAFALPAGAQPPGLPEGLQLPEGLRPAAPADGPPAPAAVWAKTVEDRVTALAFSPDGETLAVGTFEAVELLGAEDGEPVRTLKTRSGFAEALRWAEPGVLTVGDYRRVTRWDPDAGRGLKKFTGPRGYVTGLAVSDDALFAGAEDGTVRRWPGDSEPVVVQPLGEESRVPARGLAVHGDRLAVVFGDPNRDTKGGPAFLLDAATLDALFPLPTHTRAAECVTFSTGGGYVLTGGADETARLSRFDEQGEPQPVGRYGGHARPVNAALGLPSDDSQPLFATGSGGRAKGGNELRVWRFEPEEVKAEGEQVEGAADEDGPAGKVRDLAAIGDFEGPVRSLALSPDETLLAVGDDAGAVRLYRVADLTADPPAADGTGDEQTNEADDDPDAPAAEPEP
ncbi:WD40 repeat domain-containing protein [Alienimonas sp. DA493]|uniref:WD40 repeat domain-containing protein n=1 Tax=Alienimonas sp. DA493 TaxID=3373605 RepID=UPI003754AF39